MDDWRTKAVTWAIRCNNCGTKSCANNGKIGVPIGCNDYTPPKPQTNADRIRQMNDEELARFLPEIRNAITCVLGTDEGCPRPDDPCSDCWLDWLKAPAEEVDE